MSQRATLATVAAVVVVAGGAGGYALYQGHAGDDKDSAAAKAAASNFADAWSKRTLGSVSYAGSTPAAVATRFATDTAALGSGKINVRVISSDRRGSFADAKLKVDWTLPNSKVFSWTDPITLAKNASGWSVNANDLRWHPSLAVGDRFVATVQAATRGEITGAGGADIMTNQKVYDVAIDPVQATTASITQLQNVTSITGLVAKYQAAAKAKSQATISVVTYRSDDYSTRAATLKSLPGVVVTEREQPLAATRTFGQPILGGVGPVTADMIKANPKLVVGQYAGTSGVQLQYNSTLAASDGLTIATAKTPDTAVFSTDPVNGKNVATTLDPRVQNAAETALASLKGAPSALVAVDVKTGNILAAANGPTYGIERALTGHYAPGSTLKVATTYELLTKGFNPATPVACPQQLIVDGYRITNFEGETLGNPPFTQDFAHSCNTAFVNATKDFGDSDLQTGAKALGVGGDWGGHVGFKGAYAGDVPTANGATDKAASVFGQGRTQASPLALAVMAGSVARGSFVAPVLVTSPAPAGSRTPVPLQAGADKALQSMMRLTVTGGTATVLKDAAGGDVFAKTGTAEFSEGGKTGAHAWLAGWQGDIAFAALVEDVPAGKGGGTVAAPVVKTFLNALATSN